MSSSAPRWLADEMVGRLARYLRFLGHDTEYARGVDDDEIVRRARAEGRILLTRDRRLAARVPSAVLLASPDLADQLRAVRAAAPGVSFEPRFDRCTRCNGPLSPRAPRPRPSPVGAPSEDSGVELYECTRCGHVYWEGSHTRSVRARVAQWLQPTSDALP